MRFHIDDETARQVQWQDVEESGALAVALCWTGGLRFVPRPSSNRPRQSQHVSVLFYMAETPVDMDPWRRVQADRWQTGGQNMPKRHEPN